MNTENPCLVSGNSYVIRCKRHIRYRVLHLMHSVPPKRVTVCLAVETAIRSEPFHVYLGAANSAMSLIPTVRPYHYKMANTYAVASWQSAIATDLIRSYWTHMYGRVRHKWAGIVRESSAPARSRVHGGLKHSSDRHANRRIT